MGRENNYLLGNGERLASVVKIPRTGGPKNPPYSFETAKQNLEGWLTEAEEYFDKLPTSACPKDLVTAVITMHPRYISKSEFPSGLFDEVRVFPVGGKVKKIKPREWGVKQTPKNSEVVTDEIIVMGTRKNITRWSESIMSWKENDPCASEIQKIEFFRPYRIEEKIKGFPKQEGEVLLEVVLHSSEQEILLKFEEYVNSLKGKIALEKVRHVEDLTFIPVLISGEQMDKLAEFSFVRVVRSMPQIRPTFPQVLRSAESPLDVSNKAIKYDKRVAIFDGGIPTGLAFPWLREPDAFLDISEPIKQYQDHGLGVTSAFVFGPINENVIENPICNVDHFRVLDKKTGNSGDFDYYDVLDRIIEVFEKNEHEFYNISLGPDISIDDDEITRWTASLDKLLEGGGKFVTVAAGNSGMRDEISGLNRVQPPADAVNVLAVGACDSEHPQNWCKSAYSSVGPGRCPGLVKPDGVTFGGGEQEKFGVLGYSGNELYLSAVQGTSFAAPYALRTAIGVHSELDNLTPLAIRALMIHRAESSDNEIKDVGWGRFETNIFKLITCEDDEALVIYQGVLPEKDYLRLSIPMLNSADLVGNITLTATMVISPPVDPNYPNAYTRAGLEATFRPNSEKYKVAEDGKSASTPTTKPFFQTEMYGLSERELRSEGYKWEPCVKREKTFRATSLNQPMFDIYYHNRSEAMAEKEKKREIPYAFIISIKAPKIKEFHNKIVRKYSNILVPLRPKVQINIPVN